MNKGIYLSMPVADSFGAGTCGKYLLREFAKRGEVLYDPCGDSPELDTQTRALVDKHHQPLIHDVNIPLIQFTGPDLERQTVFYGEPTVGYIFSEWEPIIGEQRDNLKGFDTLVAGSEWNANVIREAGFECAAVPQGVDRDIFHPMERAALKDRFVIFSGGKFEHRKAQDLVIKAVKVLQERHDDILLLAAWFNIWDSRDYYAQAREAGVRLLGLPLYTHRELAARMNQSDIGLFPNRCEGGTNLVMMDYLACGKPVVANISTGQKDVLRDAYSVPIRGNDEALVEQMIASVESLYYNRSVLRSMGQNADKAMNEWPWSKTAQGLENAIEAYAKNRIAA